MAGIAADTSITFLNTHGHATRCCRKSVLELHTRWSEGERNGLAMKPELVELVVELLPRCGDREIARRVGISHTSVAKIRRGEYSQHRSSKWRVSGMELRVAIPTRDVFQISRVTGVRRVVPCKMIELRTGDGRVLIGDSTLLVHSDRGPISLGDLSDSGATRLLVNGMPLHQNREWLAERRRRGDSVADIARAAAVSYHTIRKWLSVHDLKFERHERDFAKGSMPWNAGAGGYRLRPRVYSEDGLARVRTARSGPNSNFWRGGLTSDRQAIGAWTTRNASAVHARFDYTCQACSKRGGRLHAHHLLPVWHSPELAYTLSNLISVCEACHREIHSSVEEEIGFAHAIGSDPTPPAHISNPARRARQQGPHFVDIRSVQGAPIQAGYALEIEMSNAMFVANGVMVYPA